jgi:prophage antirepressor-like protein
LPEQSLDQAIVSLEKVKEEAEKEKELKLPNCPHCGGKSVVDLSQLMGHTNVTVALQMLDDDEKYILAMDEGDPKLFLGSDKGGVARSINIINESGLYNLIFRSNKPEARAFRKWVTSEVLPAIRKQGYYMMEELRDQIKMLEYKNRQLQGRLEDPEEGARIELLKFIKHHFISSDKEHFELVEDIYDRSAKNVENAVSREEFVSQVCVHLPSARPSRYKRCDIVVLKKKYELINSCKRLVQDL